MKVETVGENVEIKEYRLMYERPNQVEMPEDARVLCIQDNHGVGAVMSCEIDTTKPVTTFTVVGLVAGCKLKANLSAPYFYISSTQKPAHRDDTATHHWYLCKGAENVG